MPGEVPAAGTPSGTPLQSIGGSPSPGWLLRLHAPNRCGGLLILLLWLVPRQWGVSSGAADPGGRESAPARQDHQPAVTVTHIIQVREHNKIVAEHAAVALLAGDRASEGRLVRGLPGHHPARRVQGRHLPLRAGQVDVLAALLPQHGLRQTTGRRTMADRCSTA